MKNIIDKYHVNNLKSFPGIRLFYKYGVHLLILRWSVIFASAVIYFTTTPYARTLVPPFIILIILISINLPVTLYIFSKKFHRKFNITLIFILDIIQGSLAVILTGGYSSLFFVLYLLSFFEAGLFFNWRLASVWIVGIDLIQVAATTIHWTAAKVPVSTYDLVSRFIRLLIVGLIIIIQGELLRREEENQQKALQSAEDLKKLNEIFTKLESTSFNERRIFQVLLSSILPLENVLYAFVIYRIDIHKDKWEIRATSNPELFPVGSVYYNLINYKAETSILRKGVHETDANHHFFKSGARELIGLNLADYNEYNKGILMIGKNDSPLPVSDETFFLKALALEAQLILHNYYAFQDKQEQIKKLAEFKETQATFFSAAGHEIKTPLTILKTLQSTLELTIPAPTENQKDILTTMKANIERLDNLTTDILETAKLENSDLTLHRKETDIIKIVRSRIEAIQPLAESKNQKILFKISHGGKNIATVCGDRKRLIEIISNLLSNAIKFSPANTNLIITYSTEEDNVIICVYDKGASLSLKEQKNIFKKYYTSSPDKALTGFGLGLYITEKLVELHNGRICVDTHTRWKGFCFTIPVFSKENCHES